nr:MAG TPA: hypothetical protein [Microviridae sp.]
MKKPITLYTANFGDTLQIAIQRTVIVYIILP